MADDSMVHDDRPSSPEVPSQATRKERRKSGSKSPTNTELIDLKRILALKKRPSLSDRNPPFSNLPASLPETSAAGSARVYELEPEPTDTASTNKTHGQKLVFRRPRLPVHTEGEDDALTRKDLNIVLHDISQSMWIENPNDHSTEKVYLTIEAAALEQMLTIDTYFCWMCVSLTPLMVLEGLIDSQSS